MKTKTPKLAIIIMLFILLTGCVRDEFMDLYGFSDRFSCSELTPEDFYTEKTEDGKNAFFTYFSKGSTVIMLKLICSDDNKTDEVRIYIPKYDENANNKAITAEDISFFIGITSSALRAFTGWNETVCEDITDRMCLYDRSSYEKEGELTMTRENFHIVYHSASIGSEFIIYNTFLTEVPVTEKPESKPVYGDTTKIRTETVPTK
ncbi:MAG: hypothetical protein IJO73_03815 [Clostridia bacterium]|nr:hypothetical protein [Clostridia bacterium]